jgi:hypothetical protein
LGKELQNLSCNAKCVWWNCNRNVVTADSCGRALAEVSRITISPAALPTMTAPADTTVACGALTQVPSHFLMD